jgi:sec-independent protein translocase protein TatA
MGSLGTGELIVIAIAALVVFGPKRLPELARKAGELLAKARTATRSLTDSLDGDYEDIAAPLQTLKSEYDATVKEIKNIGTTVTGLGTTLPGEEVNGRQSTVDGTEEEADSSQPTADSSQEVGDSSEDEADISQLTAHSLEEAETGDSGTVDPLPSTVDSPAPTVDSPAPTDDRESS